MKLFKLGEYFFYYLRHLIELGFNVHDELELVSCSYKIVLGEGYLEIGVAVYVVTEESYTALVREEQCREGQKLYFLFRQLRMYL